MGKYRVHFQVIDKGIRPTRRDIEIEVSGENLSDAEVKAKEIARRDYGDNVRTAGIVIYFRPFGLSLVRGPSDSSQAIEGACGLALPSPGSGQ